MASTGSLHQTPHPMNKTRLPGRVVLVMQGGGALGSYQAGAYQALNEAGIEPDWVIGTSIEAINGAILAGNEVVDLVDGCAVRFNQGNRHVAMTTYNAVH
jgi:NTE family protein